MLFAIFMTVAAIAATIFVGIFAGGVWGAMAFAALTFAIYRCLPMKAVQPAR